MSEEIQPKGPFFPLQRKAFSEEMIGKLQTWNFGKYSADQLPKYSEVVRESMYKEPDSSYLRRIKPPINVEELTSLSEAYKQGKSFKTFFKTMIITLKLFLYSYRKEVKELASVAKLSTDKIKQENEKLHNSIQGIIENKGDPEILRQNIKNQLLNIKNLAVDMAHAIEQGMATRERKEDIPLVNLALTPQILAWEELLDTILQDKNFNIFIEEGQGNIVLLDQIKEASEIGVTLIQAYLEE